MKTPPLFLTLFLMCLCTTPISATTQPPIEAGTTSSPEAIASSDAISKVNITDEEKNYIEAECIRFAVDDEITPDDLADYISLCSYELTIAVKTALMERRTKKKRQEARTIKADKRTADQPQPM